MRRAAAVFAGVAALALPLAAHADAEADAATVAQRIAGRPKTGKPFDFEVWFSDTYVRTPDGWRYAFGQAGQHLPPAA